MELGSGSFSQEVPCFSDWARSQLLSWRSIVLFGFFKQALFFNAALNHYHKTAKVLMVYFYTYPRFPAQWNYCGNDGRNTDDHENV